MEAIKDALRALRKRHLLEEGAHAPAISALSRPIISQVVTLFVPFSIASDFANSNFTLLLNYNNC